MTCLHRPLHPETDLDTGHRAAHTIVHLLILPRQRSPTAVVITCGADLVRSQGCTRRVLSSSLMTGTCSGRPMFAPLKLISPVDPLLTSAADSVALTVQRDHVGARRSVLTCPLFSVGRERPRTSTDSGEAGCALARI